MGDVTGIGWADSTLNLWIGCTQLSPACDHCYAMSTAPRLKIKWNAPPVRTALSAWAKIEAYQRGAPAFAAKHGRRRRVFINSMSDFFDKLAKREWQHEACRRMGWSPDVIWMLVTKRPQLVKKRVPSEWLEPGGWPENVWLLVTVENQTEANRRLPILLELKNVRVAGASLEPLLGMVDLTKIVMRGGRMLNALTGRTCTNIGTKAKPLWRDDGITHSKLRWAIIGGESGRQVGIRPMHGVWARVLIRDAISFGCAVFFKQWGEYLPADQRLADGGQPSIGYFVEQKKSGFHRWSNGRFDISLRVGTKASGNTIDGKILEEFPA